ncbi:MAG TPA: Panacea domain-containing protein [Stellaceae bacterium]|nr:Panacea domain-containing protein [Stellaceae bacterium]
MRAGSPLVQFDRAKFKEVVLFICSICDPDRLGAVKLHKILYLSDMVQFAFEGRPITGSTYRKRDFGPTSQHLLSTLRALELEGAIRIGQVQYFQYIKRTYVPLRDPNLALLSEEEITLIRDAADFVANHNTAKTISDFSHNRAWEMADFGAEIPYNSAFALFPSEVSPETIEWAVSVAGEVEAERPQRPAVDYTSFADFRSRMQAGRG